MAIRKLTTKEAVEVVSEMKRGRKFIRGTKGQDLKLRVTIESLATGSQYEADALLDSGATGSCVNKDYVEAQGLQIKKLPLPLPVYNADGTLNEGGAIEGFVEVRMLIGDHAERIELAVTNLGKTDIFLGLDWLRYHNPNIDWAESTLTFDRCPDRCGYMPEYGSPEDDDEDVEEKLEEGERIFWMDWDGYRSTGQKLRTQASPAATPYLNEFADVFSKADFDQLPERRPWDHAIELTPGSKPIDCKVYPLNPAEQRALDEFLEENIRTGRIRSSTSPMASPFFFVRKKDGSLRPVQDYRKLNDMTIKNRYPLPLIQELIDKLKGAKWFTKMDVRWGFNNVRIKDGDEWKAAFRTNRGLFEPLVMFFGLTNSPATFQSFMNHILKELIDEGHVIVYLDDILIFTDTLEEHRQIVRRVLEILRKNKLYLKPEKCEFEVNEVEYLGVIVGSGKIRMDPKKVSAMTGWKEPTKKKEVQSFLGFCNFFRRFIRGFSGVARPLTQLTGNAEWVWKQEQQDAFDELKRRIAEDPVLLIPREHGKFRVEADSSDYANGAVLSQFVDGKWRPVAFRSRALNETERNYEIYDKEMMAIMDSMEEWRQYLLGAKETVEVFTDHQNLQYFRKPQKLNRRQARWVTELGEYDIQLTHKPGKTMGKADALSRMTGLDRGEKDNENVTLLKPELFISRIHFSLNTHTVDTPEDIILTKIKQRKANKDKYVQVALEKKEKDWEETDDGVVTWQGRIYVPKDRDLRGQVIQAHHDTVLAGHPGRYKTQELITRNYWWPGISRDVRTYVTGCEKCQATKAHRSKPVGPLHPHDAPTEPWETIGTDLIGELPESGGYNAISVTVDHFTKRVRLVPTHMSLTSEGMARIYRDRIFPIHGLPRKIVHDRGPQYHSQFMKELYRLLGIQGNFTTAYHPQTNGQTERMNQEIEHYLRVFVNYHQSDWDQWLPTAEFVLNDREHTATKTTPFFADNGRHPYKGTAPKMTSKNQTAQEFADGMKKVREEVGAALKKAAEDMKKYYDRKRTETVEYKPGDMVWLEGTNLSTDRPAKKMGDKRFGPFKVVKKVGHSSYKLTLPRTWKNIHPVFNEVLLSPYHPPEFPSQPRNTRPPPVVEGEEPEWEVEEIVNSRTYRGAFRYKVQWKGYGAHEQTWEPISNVEHAAEAIAEFHRRFPNKPKPPRLARIEIPISQFPTHLFRPIPQPDTEPTPSSMPSEALANKLAQNGTCALRRG